MIAYVVVVVSVSLSALPSLGQQTPNGGPAMVDDSEPGRLVLENVPYIGPNWRDNLDGPQDFMLPSALGAVMKFLGEPEPYRYRLFMATSSIAFQALWHPTKWDSGFDNIWLLSADPLEPIRRTMQAAGYGYRLIGNAGVGEKQTWFPPAGALDESLEPDALRQQVCAEIRAGRPVIALGLMSGAAVVAGYEDDGNTLVGWSMFDEKQPPERDPLGYLRFPNWPELTEAVLFVGEKRAQPPLEDSLKKALLWAVQGFRTPQVGEYASGLAGFDAWAQALQDDGRWKADDLDALKAAAQAHFFATLTVAEGRAFGAEAPERLAELRPEAADDLHVADGSYHLMHDLVWRLWQTAEGTVGPADPPLRFTDSGVRRELARLVLLERDLDANAATHLERALHTLGVPAADFPPTPQTESEAVARVSAMLNILGGEPSRVYFGTPEQGGWIDGTPPLGWMQGKDCTFIGALESALAPTACPYPYTDLMGYSGLAFRTRWFHNPEQAETPWGALRWHPVSPHGEGPEEIAALSRATGWHLRREELPTDRNDPAYQRLITDLVISINAGLPAIIGLNTDLATVYGYHIWSMNLIVRDYQRAEQDDVRTQANDPGFHSPVTFLEGHEDPPEPREALLESLKIAVRNGAREPADGFQYGPAALRTWRDDLAGYDAYTDDERSLLFLANWWSLMHLADARAAAVTFLGANADLLAGDSQASLLRALDSCKQEAQLLRQFADEHLDSIQWYGGTRQASDWDAQTRQAQVELLATAAELEGEALKALQEVPGGEA